MKNEQKKARKLGGGVPKLTGGGRLKLLAPGFARAT
jgi:hypothetical protein